MAHRWKVLTLVSVAVFLVSLDMFIVNVAFPNIKRGFDTGSVASVSWVLNAYAIVLAALMVPAGRLADRSGRRRVFLIGLVVFAAGSALCGASPSVGMLVGARVIQAIGAACLLPTSLALLLPEFPPRERAAAIGVWAALGGIAAALGPPAGGLLVQVSWRLVFYVNVPVVLIALWFSWRLLRESRDPSRLLPDLAGAALLTAAVALLALGFVQGPGWTWGDARTLGALAAGIVGLGAFWVRCQVHPSPIVEPALLRVRAYALANTTAVAFSASFSAMLLAAVLFMTGVWHDSVLTAGLSLAPGPLTAAAFAVPAGRFGDRAGQGRLAVAGTLLFAAGCGWWLWRMSAKPDYAAAMLPGLLVTGAGVGLTLPSLTSAAAASLPPERFATGSAVFTMSRQLGFVLGVAVLVAVLGTSHGSPELTTFRHGWWFMVITAVLAAATASGIGELKRHTPADRSESTASAEPLAVEASGS